MSLLIEVAFKGNRKEFFLWELPQPPALRAAVIVDADRGEDLGRVHSTGDAAKLRCEKCSHGLGSEMPARRALRTATPDDVRREKELRVQDEEARRRAMEHVKTHNLAMKLSDAEWQWDGRKLTFYFTAEKRVDFRKLVRDLASTFRARIELKQIGVRDEAKRLDGVGRCGRQYCSASWLPELRPVNLGVAKDQKLSLNPSQISGACGRLMCCLRYEHEFYAQSRKRFPKEGKVIVAARGEEKIIYNDIFRDRVSLKNAEGEMRVVALLDLRAEMELAQQSGGVATVATTDSTVDEDDTEAEDAAEVALGDRADVAADDWRRLSGRVLPLALGSVTEEDELADEDERVELVAEFDPDLSGSDAQVGAETSVSESTERPRRRRGRRGGRRGKKRRRDGEGGGGGGDGGGGADGNSPGGAPNSNQ